MKSLEQLEKEKEAIYDIYMAAQVKLYQEEVRSVLSWFKEKFPKRHLMWMDGMGTGFWVLDGEIWDCDVFVRGETSIFSKTVCLTEREWTRVERLLKPLVDFHTSIHDVTFTHPYGVEIGQISTDDV